LIRQKYKANENKHRDVVMGLYNRAAAVVDNSLLPTGFAKDYAAFNQLREEMDPSRLYAYLRTFNTDDVAQRIRVDRDALATIITDLEDVIRIIDADFVPLKDAIDFLATDDQRFRDNRYFIPARKFIIPVDTANLSDAVKTDAVKKVLVDEVRFTMSNDVIYKNTIAMLDMLGNNNWERPIYFSNTVSNDNFLNMESAFMQEGLAYRIAPVNVTNSETIGLVDTERMYRRLVEEFEWGRLNEPDVFMDENNIRMTIKYRYAFATLAKALSDEGNDEKAIEVLDYCMEHMPHEVIPFNFSIVPIIQSYYVAGAVEKALELSAIMEEVTTKELDYFAEVINDRPRKAAKMQNDFLQLIRDLNTLGSIAMGFGEMEVSARLQEKVDTYIPVFERHFRF
jgi:hypothetical protein